VPGVTDQHLCGLIFMLPSFRPQSALPSLAAAGGDGDDAPAENRCEPPEDDEEVIRSDKVRDQQNVPEVINIWKLPNCTDDYQAMLSLAQGNDGKVNKIFIKHKPHVVKFYKTGLNAQYVTFQQSLLVQRDSADAQRQPGYQAVYFIAVPVGYVVHKDQIGLVFNYVVQPRVARQPTAGDCAQVKDQMKFLHWLGYCHLDITDRNILLGDNNKCYLLDFDCVCAVGLCALGPLPPESSDRIKRRDPAEVEDDLHLWYQLQGTFFKDLPAEQLQPAPPPAATAARDEKKQSNAAAPAACKCYYTTFPTCFGAFASHVSCRLHDLSHSVADAIDCSMLAVPHQVPL